MWQNYLELDTTSSQCMSKFSSRFAELEALLKADAAAADAQRQAAAAAEAVRREAASAERRERERLAHQRSEEKRTERAQREREKADGRYVPKHDRVVAPRTA